MVPRQELRTGALLFLRGPSGGRGAQGTTQYRLNMQHTCLSAAARGTPGRHFSFFL